MPGFRLAVHSLRQSESFIQQVSECAGHGENTAEEKWDCQSPCSLEVGRQSSNKDPDAVVVSAMRGTRWASPRIQVKLERRE